MYFKMTDLEKKRFMRDFIDEIELYPERQEDGRILKQLHLGFPVFYEGSEGDTIRLLKQNTVEACCLLTKTSRAQSEFTAAAVPASAKHESGTSDDLFERVSNRKADAKVHIDVDLEDYYRIKDAQGKDGK